MSVFFRFEFLNFFGNVYFVVFIVKLVKIKINIKSFIVNFSYIVVEN